MRHATHHLTYLIAALAALSCASYANAIDFRQWTDSSGVYKVEAMLVTADDNLAFLERKDGELIAVQLKQLALADQQLIAKHLAAKKSPTATAVDTTWKLKDGDVVTGRLMGFGRQQLIVKRERGDLLVNDRPLKELPAAYRKILPNVVSVVDEKKIDDLDDLEAHLADLGGGPFKYIVTGVQLDLREQGEITIPLGLLTNEEAKAISPGFERWQAAQAEEVSKANRYEVESRERMALESRHQMRQRNRQRETRQLRLLELGLLAVDVGVTDVWEVAVYPPTPYGYWKTVLVTAPNSLQASRKVAQRYPQWRIGAIAKRSN